MSDFERITTRDVDDVTIVHFLDRKILDAANIQHLGIELNKLYKEHGKRSLLLNFGEVEFLSSAALNMLILLNKRMSADGSHLVLTDLRPEIAEIFSITQLHKVFNIQSDEAAGLAAF